ncbi:P-loop containing nucleoside triphosphate hydrolase protein [Gloeopeniophorella convolvens]|nr:P-loop containing nucleoside triphosphate hydrolase protein [Gloeopeniophorella convolvens]
MNQSEATRSAPDMLLNSDYLEQSTTSTQVDLEITIGSVDGRYAQNALCLINNLRDIDLDRDVDLPCIVIIGSQSSGKSSTIQAVSGVPLLKAPGDACTRCPLECRLTRADGPWTCVVSLRHVTTLDRGSTSVSQPKVTFGDAITEKAQLEDRILRAQLAILNPSRPSSSFLDPGADLASPPELSFSPDIVCLEITGPEYHDISFVDLPGLIRTVGTSGDRENIQLIENLAISYIKKENSIILVTITCETDFANQGAYELARTYDPEGKRTVGVLTKPDRSPEGLQDKWEAFIRGEAEMLQHGWFGVKQPDTQSPHPLPSLTEARQQEEMYFKKHWGTLPRQYRSHLQTKNLVRHLAEILSSLISSRMPDIINQIRDQHALTSESLECLGKPPSNDSVGEVMGLIDQITRDVEAEIEGRSGNILALIEKEAAELGNKLRHDCPEFRPWNHDEKDTPELTLPDFLVEDGVVLATSTARRVIFLNEIMEKKTPTSARGLPGSSQDDIAQQYLRTFTRRWDLPARQFVLMASSHLRSTIKKTINARCGQLANGGLDHHMTTTIALHLDDKIEQTLAAADLLVQLERNAHTRDERQFRQYKEKFFEHFKMLRPEKSGNTFLRDLARMKKGGQFSPPVAFVSGINAARKSLASLGLPLAEEGSLAKLLPPDPSDPALEDMARAYAGFEVALRRFTDYVPLAVDAKLVRGLGEGLASALRESFKLSEPGALERCREFLREPPKREAEREELRQKMDRLTRAAQELQTSWPWTSSAP